MGTTTVRTCAERRLLPSTSSFDAPRGVIVGTAVISHVTNGGTGATAYEWHLVDVQCLLPSKQRKPKCQPQPIWFRPF